MTLLLTSFGPRDRRSTWIMALSDDAFLECSIGEQHGHLIFFYRGSLHIYFVTTVMGDIGR